MQTALPQPQSQSRFRWADLIRALGAFLVTLAHLNYQGSGSALVQQIYYALTRAAVPLFFMVSGYLLLSKNESPVEFFRKRAVKVFFPFLVWSVVYLLWHGEALGRPFADVFKIYLLKILRGPRENHLWFFYELFGLYLFTPVLRVYLQKAERKDLYYFLGAWLLFVPVLKTVQDFTPIRVGFSYSFLWGYVGYFLFGYFAGTREWSAAHKRAAWALFFAALFLTVAGMAWSASRGIKNQYFEDYLSVNVVCMSAALFVALLRQPVSDSAYRFVLPLSRASFGVYLAHVIVMAELFALQPFSALLSAGSNFYMLPLLAALSFALTFLLVFVLQKIPIVKNLVP